MYSSAETPLKLDIFKPIPNGWLSKCSKDFFYTRKQSGALRLKKRNTLN